MWGASLSGWYGTSGCGPSGGRGRHGVGQRGDPGSGAGHWGHSRKKAQAWPRPTGVPSMGSCGPKGPHAGLGSTKPRRSPRQQGPRQGPGPLGEARERLARAGRQGQRRQEPWAPLQTPPLRPVPGPLDHTGTAPSCSQHIPPSSLSQQQPGSTAQSRTQVAQPQHRAEWCCPRGGRPEAHGLVRPS